jgi:ubiquinone/menaquinone biosynthesis C-methylase UbiE
MVNKKQHWNGMYKLPLGDIPWEIVYPPDDLIEIIESWSSVKGNALDVACGTGNYSIYLAEQGFEVIGVDFSENALAVAEEHAKRRGLEAKFLEADANNLNTVLQGINFDFILDYSLLHHIAPEDIVSYAKQFYGLLKTGGKLLLVCYSEKDNFSRGKPKVTGKYGNTMYYRTRREIEGLYPDLYELAYKESRLGKRLHHFAHCFLFEKR